MSNLLKIYESMLDSIGCKVDEKGFVSTLTPGSEKSMPMSVGGKRLVLPYKEQLEMTDWSKRIGFHPMLQNFSAGESPVMDAVRNRANRFFGFITGTLFMDLAKLAASKEKHIALTPEQAKYIGPFSDADDKFANYVQNLIILDEKSRRGNEFIRFNTAMGREWQGQKRNRVAVCTFPLYEALDPDNKATVIANIKFTAKQVKMLRAMYQYLFPHIDEIGYYEVGSDSKISPSVESLYGLFDIIIQNHNAHVLDLMDVIPSGAFILVPNEWSDDIKNLNGMTREIRSIPPLEGNAGRDRNGKNALTPTLITEPARKQAKVEVTESGTPIIDESFIEEAKQVQSQSNATAANPFRHRLGDPAGDSFVDPRTQLNEDISVVQPRGNQNIVNMNAFEPSKQYGQFAHERRQQEAQQRQAAQQQQQQNGVQVQRVPESAVLINGAMYIPLEIVGTGQPPAGSIMHNGKLYVAYGAPAQQHQMQGHGFGTSRFGVGQVTDPAQLPELSQGEINMYRQNPAMFQSYLQSRGNQAASRTQQVQNERLTELPPYLQRLQRANEAAEQQNSPFRRR